MHTDLTWLRKMAGENAVRYVKDGMTLGVGSGRTNGYFIDRLGELYQLGEITDIRAVPTSESTGARLRFYGIPIVNLVDFPKLDLAVDGADEVDPEFNLIKGLGRALMREKIVEIHAKELLIIVDESKLVDRLGTHVPLPVEILQFQAESHIQWLGGISDRAELLLEADGKPVVTDNGNFLVHCWFHKGIPDASALNDLLNKRPGILEHGLFLQMATRILVAEQTGVRILEKKNEG